MSTLGAAHFTSALAALALGALVFLERKGTFSLRAIGAAYLVALLLVNLTALGIYRLNGHFGPFHALALASLATMAWGMEAVLRRRHRSLQRHYYSMAWSYIGLLAAAGAEIAVRVPAIAATINTAGRAIALGLAIAGLFMALGFALLPRLQRRVMGSVENGRA